MSGPDRIWAWAWEARPSRGQWSSAQEIVGEGHEYIRRDPAVIAALPEVQAIVGAAVKAALDDVTTLHRVIADIRTETVGHKPMLSELPQALVQWRDAAVKAEREACSQIAEGHGEAAKIAQLGRPIGGWEHDRRLVEEVVSRNIAAAIRKFKGS